MNKALQIFNLIASNNTDVFAPSITSVDQIGENLHAKWIDDRDCEMFPIQCDRVITVEDIVKVIPQAEEMMPFEDSYRFANGVLQILTLGDWNGILHDGWWHESDSYFFKVAMQPLNDTP